MPRWLKKTLIGTAATVGVLALVVVIARASFRRVGTKELERITTQLDADDPGWRLDAVLAAREKSAPPPDRNPAEVARRVREEFSPAWKEFRTTRDFGSSYVTNEYPGLWATVWYLQAGTVTAEAREAARTQFLRPEVAGGGPGYVALHVPDNPFMTLLPHAQNTREVFEILEVDAKLAALEGRPDHGIRSARAGLVAARALGDEPFLISQLVRMAGAHVAANSGMQVLAWGEPKDDAGLAAFQAALRVEADVPYLLHGLRGERATLDRVFDGLENGTIPPNDVLGMVGGGGSKSALVFPAFALYKGLLPGDRAMALKLYTEMIEAAKKPPHEQKKALADVTLPFGDGDRFRYFVTRLTLPATQKVGEASVRARATLLTASAAVACERFRLARGRWPESLAEIPADLLPPDPYTGGAIQYQRTDDGGVIVFTAADDTTRGVAFNNHTHQQEQDPLGGAGRGWKLWPPDARGDAPGPRAARARPGRERAVTRRTVVLVERRTRAVRLRPADAAFLRQHFPGVVEVSPDGRPDRYRLTARGVVGSIDAPHVRLTIRPKLPWPNLRLLLGLEPFAAGGVAAPAADLLAVLAAEFAERLRDLTAAGLVCGYRDTDVAAPYLRGRLRTADQLRDAAARAFPTTFHVTESAFDLDTPWNQIPKAVADALANHPALPWVVRAGVSAAAAPLDGVAVVAPTDARFADAEREPRAGAYTSLLALCRTLRDGLDAADAAPGGGAFLIDLGRAFERHVATGLAARLPGGWSVESHPGFAVGDTVLRPDVLVRRRGAARWVLDAKWKRPGPDAADLHQVLAYAAVTGAPRAALVYPGRRWGGRVLRAGALSVSLVRLPVVGSVEEVSAGLARLARVVRR